MGADTAITSDISRFLPCSSIPCRYNLHLMPATEWDCNNGIASTRCGFVMHHIRLFSYPSSHNVSGTEEAAPGCGLEWWMPVLWRVWLEGACLSIFSPERSSLPQRMMCVSTWLTVRVNQSRNNLVRSLQFRILTESLAQMRSWGKHTACRLVRWVQTEDNAI